MKCRYPVQLNVKGREIYVPCGHCAWCVSRLRDEWVQRMRLEAKDHLYNYFMTFTYRDSDLPYNVDEESGVCVPTVYKPHISDFNRMLRRKYNLKFKFLVASEYGPKTQRPHYHGIWFCDEQIDLERLWPYGDNNVQLPANDGSYRYVLKYMLKGSKVPDGALPNFRLMSLRPGIGAGFKQDFINLLANGSHSVLTDDGHKSIPRYYKKTYLNSLTQKMREMVQEMKLDYLVAIDQHSILHKVYEDRKIQMPFEQWLSMIYKDDLQKQIKINQNGSI